MADIHSVLNEFMSNAAELAQRAVQHDQENNLEVSIYFYRESINLLERARQELLNEIDRQSASNSSSDLIIQKKKKILTIETKVNEYQTRINALEKAIILKEESEQQKEVKKTAEETQFERASYLVQQALEQDEGGHDKEAVELYTQVVEACIKAKNSKNLDPAMASKIATLATQALDRAETLKGINVEKELKQLRLLPTPGSQSPSSSMYARSSSPVPRSNLKVTGEGSYSEEEKKVLLHTSNINGIDYLPFMEVDLREKFAYPLPYSDSCGLLPLSPKQKARFTKWVRPDELWSDPKMIKRIDCFTIKQTIVSDCSFVASLAISALYEQKFPNRKKLITNIIYPQNKAGDPVYNPCGKYMVKLNLNGIPRKVIIDDLLPLGSHGELLCSYSSQKGELWVSLLEKAYMKVMGGYDFPGSNSNIDLHALTGWIPERLSIHNESGGLSSTFDKEQTFSKLKGRINTGDVLVTVATGPMSEQAEERAGLVSTHAYAVLDVKEVIGVRLFKLKNPWSAVRWKGNYSELDAVHWTPEMKKVLNYDPNSASMFDNGVFWIDYDSICKFFDVFYMSWNPDLFAYTSVLHRSWNAGKGPIKDVYNISDNPQYKLEINAPCTSAVWVLLTRHITDIQDFKENREYITVLVYDTDGKKVYYPADPAPMIDGVRINSPHYLCKIVVPEKGVKRYTLVVSQYEKMNTIYYTLRAYSSCPFTMKEIENQCKFKKKLTGEWKGRTAGGCANHPDTHKYNPVFQIALQSQSLNNKLIIDLKGPKEYPVGFDVLCSNAVDMNAKGYFTKKTSGAYRSGFVVLELDDVVSGVYNIIPSTFKPHCESTFFLTVQCSCDFNMKLIPPLVG